MIRRILVLAATFVAFVAAPAAAQYNPGQPGFVIDPNTVNPGGSVSVSGQGCPPGGEVAFSVNGQSIGTLPVSNDPDGTFTGTITIPSNLAPGTYVMVATCGDITMTNNFTVVSSTSGLPVTGSDSTVPLLRLSLVLLAAGGLLVLLVRRNSDRRRPVSV